MPLRTAEALSDFVDQDVRLCVHVRMRSTGSGGEQGSLTGFYVSCHFN